MPPRPAHHLKRRVRQLNTQSDSHPAAIITAPTVDYGAHARIGLLYMHSSFVMECEFDAMAPAGVSTHVTRIALPSVTMAGIDSLARAREIKEAVGLLAAAPVDVIAFGGTSASFLHGPGWDQDLLRRMSEAADEKHVTTTSTASLHALAAVDARRIVIATPYTDDITARASAFFDGNGFDVVAAFGLNLVDDHAIGDVDTDEVRRLAHIADSVEADAVFISCTNLRTAEVISPLERELGKPVVSAIQATLWECLRLVDGPRVTQQFGSLFAKDYRMSYSDKALSP